MNLQTDIFDTSRFGTEPRKLARYNDPPTSVKAACKVDSKKLEHLVYLAIRSFGKEGCTASQLLKHDLLKGHPPGSITTRPAKLVERGLVENVFPGRMGDYGCVQVVRRATCLED